MTVRVLIRFFCFILRTFAALCVNALIAGFRRLFFSQHPAPSAQQRVQ